MAPVVRVPVLSSTTTRIRRADSSACALLTRTPSSAPRPTAATSAAGVARPSAHGQATTRTATAALHAAAPGRPAPSQKPRVATARLITQGTKTAAIRSASRCALGLAGLRLADQPGDLGQQRVRADPGGADDQPAAHVHGGPGHRVARPDLGGHRLPGDERRVDRRAALDDHAVGGDLLPRADHEQLPRRELAQPAPGARPRRAAPRRSWRRGRPARSARTTSWSRARASR